MVADVVGMIGPYIVLNAFVVSLKDVLCAFDTHRTLRIICRDHRRRAGCRGFVLSSPFG